MQHLGELSSVNYSFTLFPWRNCSIKGLPHHPALRAVVDACTAQQTVSYRIEREKKKPKREEHTHSITPHRPTTLAAARNASVLCLSYNTRIYRVCILKELSWGVFSEVFLFWITDNNSNYFSWHFSSPCRTKTTSPRLKRMPSLRKLELNPIIKYVSTAANGIPPGAQLHTVCSSASTAVRCTGGWESTWHSSGT